MSIWVSQSDPFGCGRWPRGGKVPTWVVNISVPKTQIAVKLRMDIAQVHMYLDVNARGILSFGKGPFGALKVALLYGEGAARRKITNFGGL